MIIEKKNNVPQGTILENQDKNLSQNFEDYGPKLEDYLPKEKNEKKEEEVEEEETEEEKVEEEETEEEEVEEEETKKEEVEEEENENNDDYSDNNKDSIRKDSLDNDEINDFNNENNKKTKYSNEKITEIADAYSTKHNISLEEAKQIILKDIKSAEQFGFDPIKLARTTREQQSYISKLENEINSIKNIQKEPEIIFTDEGIEYGEIKYSKQKLINWYSNEEPEITEDLEEEKIYQLAKKAIKTKFKEYGEKKNKEIIKKAENIKEKAIEEIKIKNPKFFNDAKALLEKTDSNFLISDSFNIDHILYFVKGVKYDEDIKKAREQAYERGKRGRLIRKNPIGSGNTKPDKGKTIPKLTPDEKKLALEMFGEYTKNEQEAFRDFADIYKK